MSKKKNQKKSTTKSKVETSPKVESTAPPKKNPLKKIPNPFIAIKNFFANRSKGFQFLSIFILVMVLFYTCYYSDFYIKHVNEIVVGTQAKIGAFLLNIFGQNAKAFGSQLNGKAFSMSVSGGCDGMEVMALLIAGIIATPVAWAYKWRGILVGGAILATLNVLRLPLLYYAGGFISMEVFDFLHVQGGFVIFVFISILILLRWLSWANKQALKNEIGKESDNEIINEKPIST